MNFAAYEREIVPWCSDDDFPLCAFCRNRFTMVQCLVLMVVFEISYCVFRYVDVIIAERVVWFCAKSARSLLRSCRHGNW